MTTKQRIAAIMFDFQSYPQWKVEDFASKSWDDEDKEHWLRRADGLIKLIGSEDEALTFIEYIKQSYI